GADLWNVVPDERAGRELVTSLLDQLGQGRPGLIVLERAGVGHREDGDGDRDERARLVDSGHGSNSSFAEPVYADPSSAASGELPSPSRARKASRSRQASRFEAGVRSR